MKCPECGARNTVEAPWCTQCLTPLATPPATDPPPTGTPAPEPSTPSMPSTEDDEPTPPDRDFRTRDGEVEWRCGQCHRWNPLVAPNCTTCGDPMPGADRSGSWSRERVARTRRVLWIVAGVICVLAVLGVVLALAAVRGAG